jgi:multiple sugar transport system permease protein
MRGRIDKECAFLALISLGVTFVLYGIPFLVMLYGSLHGLENLGDTPQFVGSANFRSVLSDGVYLRATLASATFTVFAVLLQISLAVVAATLSKRSFPGVTFIRWAFVASYFLPTVVVVVAWRFFSDPFVGLLPEIYRTFGFTAPDLRGPSAALPVMVITATYEAFPFSYIILLARMFQIPQSLYQVASVNGASHWTTFRVVTWPQIRFTFTGLVLLRILITWLKFDVPWLVYAAHATSRWADTLAVAIYRSSFERLQFGQGYAASVTVVVIMWAAYVCWLLFSRRNPKGGAE